jgi:hypothetical protein
MNGFFLDQQPPVKQYGSHMVMNPSFKPTKKKYINIDTKFSDEYRTGDSYTITFPGRLNEVKSMRVVSAEIPMSFYNISTALGNNYFKITNVGTSVEYMVVLDPSNYLIADLVTAVNAKITALGITTITYDDVSNNFSKFTTSANTYTINFDVDVNGNFDKYNFRSKLGWLMGFRDQSYTITSSTPAISTAFYDISFPRYLYLVLDEFNNGVQNTFLSPVNQSLLNKKILAKITVDLQIYPFGSILHNNENLGSLITDKRTYSGGKVDIQRLSVQLVNEYGNTIDLNGLDFSFILELEFE